MSIIKAIILGIVQGLTEFLPVSSSGHLVVFQRLLAIPEHQLLFDIVLHLGTLLAVFLVYRKDIKELILELIYILKDIFKGKGLLIRNNTKRKMVLYIIIATIPTGLMGVYLNDIFKNVYRSTLIVGIMLIITGLLLWSTQYLKNYNKNFKTMTVFDAIFVGICQGFAITPGISRSGSTIVGGLFRGLNKETATKFSFLISIPAILGAAVVEFRPLLSSGGLYNYYNLSVGSYLAGFIASAISGFIAIKFLISVFKKDKLHYFAFYVWTLAVIVIFRSL